MGKTLLPLDSNTSIDKILNRIDKNLKFKNLKPILHPLV